MTVVAQIRMRNPNHGVLAVGEVQIDGALKIKDIQLHRSSITNEYRIRLPVSEGRKSACIEVLNEDLRMKITDALAACYEKGVRGSMNPLKHNSADLMEQDRVNAKQNKYKQRNKEFYNKFR
jgi:hypothetical protein